MKRTILFALAMVAFAGGRELSWGQTPATAPTTAPAAPGATAQPESAARPPNFPAEKQDPAAVERGKVIYAANSCSFCHGADARGGDSGPSLMRSSYVLTDKKGEVLGPLVRLGVPGTAMAPFNLTDAQMADLAAYLHNFQIGAGSAAAKPAPSIVVGDAAAGKTYFNANCVSCHALSSGIAHIATKYPDPFALQKAWLVPTASKPATARITVAANNVVTGRLTKIDEFSVTVVTDTGEQTFERKGAVPKVEIIDPRGPHATTLLRKYTDKDIHDVTAYLVTLK